jgi:hypothetical protein
VHKVNALLSRPEQEFFLSRYPSVATGHHHPLGSFATAAGHHNHAGMADLDHPGKLADLLLAKQAVVLNGTAVGNVVGGGGTPRVMLQSVTRLPCQARGMKADHNSSVRRDVLCVCVCVCVYVGVLMFCVHGDEMELIYLFSLYCIM